MAQLEALAAGKPVVATAVGGAGEIARHSAHMHLVRPEAPAAEYAEILARIAAGAPGAKASAVRETYLPPHFTRARMAARVRRLYPATLLHRQRRTGGDTIWLITNNFSTGGAQTSARRLLTGFAEAGRRVHAATVEEDPAHPTAGRRALFSRRAFRSRPCRRRPAETRRKASKRFFPRCSMLLPGRSSFGT